MQICISCVILIINTRPLSEQKATTWNVSNIIFYCVFNPYQIAWQL